MFADLNLPHPAVMNLAMRSVIAILLLFVVSPLSASVQLDVHEWGTITTRHLPGGEPEGRLNHIKKSEVLPAFVHHFEPEGTQMSPLRKSIETDGRLDVTMRLETPVIYFHLPEGEQFLDSFDVKVDFRGGVINEFYPNGKPSVALDLDRVKSKSQAGLLKKWDGKQLGTLVKSSLEWNGLHLTHSFKFPCTAKEVWLAPRRVKSSNVVNAEGEVERYLFYRGVANLNALFQTSLKRSRVSLWSPLILHWMPGKSMIVPKVWVLDSNELGEMAFTEQANISIRKDQATTRLWTVEPFKEKDYSYANVGKLRKSMKQTLIDQGLFEDEANAMLETWRDSYFMEYGTRVFYIVPGDWVDYHLPLDISVPHKLTRVYLGKIVLWEE